jgi:hypothetical protein
MKKGLFEQKRENNNERYFKGPCPLCKEDELTSKGTTPPDNEEK